MIYFIRQSDYVKIGYASDVRTRLSDLQVASPYDLSVLFMMEGDYDKEKELHDRFVKDKIRGEWYILSEDIREYIEKNRSQDLRYDEGLVSDEDIDGSVQTRYIRNQNKLNLRQMGELLGVTPQSVREAESRELQGTISISALRKYGDALGYDLVYKFIFRG